MTSPIGSTTRSEARVSWTSYETSFGTGWLGWHPDGSLVKSLLPGSPQPVDEDAAPPDAVRRLAEALGAYFSGSGALPDGEQYLAAAASTPLEAAVYRTVAVIPAGATRTYAEIAREVGRPRAARAVGAAMAKNRFPPMIPCHRVVGSNGLLRGYAGGIEMKQSLLDMESSDG
jgi:methylated-DNA-[protein]-cysteine S-methyltransferase